ALPRRHL
ncbi:hypothetical protein BN1723_019786, partial [Verticillium longisporum]